MLATISGACVSSALSKATRSAAGSIRTDSVASSTGRDEVAVFAGWPAGRVAPSAMTGIDSNRTS
jgi:hypothetical protein